MHLRPPRILCIEPELSLLDSRSAILKQNGYDTYPVSLKVTEVVLASQSFDLIILSSSLTESEKEKIGAAAGDTQTMVLKEFTMPTVLLSEVARRLSHTHGKIA